MTLEDIITKSTLFKHIESLVTMEGGLLKDFTKRVLICADLHWWQKDTSPWKVTVEHPLQDPNSTTPDYWMEEVLDLCELEPTHEVFGLSFTDLMSMDPATFEKIKKRIYDYLRRQQEKMNPELKKELARQ